ncbi:MAG: DUF899 domain-containing protein [Caldilineaceae bacterium]|nr:DUF899 domain-containing protein [Caldilineaceae bacterium]
MTAEPIPHPAIATRAEWLAARKNLLDREKAATRANDQLSAERRRLPMVKVDKRYTFAGPAGQKTLLELFEGRHQLIVYHFMFDPEWENGCPGCTSYVNALGDLSDLPARDTTFVLISRAPLDKLDAYKSKKGWDHPWYSSYGSDFNYDFHVTLDEAVTPPEYNYRPQPGEKGERPGTSVFFRLGDEIYHTYSTFGRGGESLTHSYALFDITPYGRQEDWEDSPAGWPQRPTYG